MRGEFKGLLASSTLLLVALALSLSCKSRVDEKPLKETSSKPIDKASNKLCVPGVSKNPSVIAIKSISESQHTDLIAALRIRRHKVGTYGEIRRPSVVLVESPDDDAPNSVLIQDDTKRTMCAVEHWLAAPPQKIQRIHEALMPHPLEQELGKALKGPRAPDPSEDQFPSMHPVLSPKSNGL